MSTKLTPAASILTSASAGPGAGVGSSSNRRTSGPPDWCTRTAFMRLAPRVCLRQVEHDHLQLGHLLDRVLGTFLPEAALLEAAVGHQVDAPLRSPVDVDVAGLDLAGEPHRPVDVLRED